MATIQEVIRTLGRVSTGARWQQLFTNSARIYFTYAPKAKDITRVFGPAGTPLTGGMYTPIMTAVGDTSLTDYVDLTKYDLFIAISHVDIPDIQSNMAVFQSVWIGVIHQYLPGTDEMITSVIRNRYGLPSYNRKLPCVVK